MIYACQAFDAANQCLTWQAISMPVADPDLYAERFLQGAGIILIPFIMGLTISAAIKLVKMVRV